MQTCNSPKMDGLGWCSWTGETAEFLSETALCAPQQSQFYWFPIMRQALLMRRTIEHGCLAIYQSIQSFAHEFVCANTTAWVNRPDPAARQLPC
jgi:hypothetical protein